MAHLLRRFVQRLRWRSQLPTLAEEIADQVFPFVWQRVGNRVLEMPPAESRGYTRVLAAAEIRQHVANTLLWLQLPSSWQDGLTNLATELILARVAQQVELVLVPVTAQRRIA